MTRGKYERKNMMVNSARIGFLITDDVHDILRKLAYEQKCHMAEIVRTMIDENLQQKGLLPK